MRILIIINTVVNTKFLLPPHLRWATFVVQYSLLSSTVLLSYYSHLDYNTVIIVINIIVSHHHYHH